MAIQYCDYNIKGTLTVGADAAGHDVMFRGGTSGAYFMYDASEDGVVIVAPTDEVALGIRVVGSSQPTVPQFTVGRDTGQYLGIKVDDRISSVIHRQDETDAGTMQMNQEIWDNGTGVGKWNWIYADGAGSFPSTKMTLNKTGELDVSTSVTSTTFLGDLNGTINTATTGTTQSAGNNSTLIATTAYADAAAAAAPQGTVTGTGANNRLAVWTSATNIEGESELTYDGNILTVGGTGNTTTFLDVIGTNTAGSPATAAAIRIYGYEGRGEGIFYYDSDYTAAEWYSGIPYGGGNTYQIGYDATGNQAQYTANAVMTMNASKNTFFAGDLTVTGGDITLGGTGRIQGVDTVSAPTDAANKAYVDASVPSLTNYVTLTTAQTISGAKTFTGITQFDEDTQHASNVEARWGNANDLRIFHNGTNNYILSAATDTYYTGSAVTGTSAYSQIFKQTNFNGGDEEYLRISGPTRQVLFSRDAKFIDGIKCTFGTSATSSPGDLEIYHDGTDSIIENTNGDLYIINESLDKDVIIQSDNGATGQVVDYFRADGSVGNSILYGNYGTKRLETSSTGVTITGIVSGLTNPTAAQDAATKAYVDAAVAGVPVGDITGVTAGTNLNGGGTSGAVTLNLDAAIELTSVELGSGVTLSESTDRADLLYINSSTSSWGGLQIGNTSNEFIFSLMGNGSVGGIYDDQNSDWLIDWTENGGVRLYYNGGQKLITTNSGVTITGTASATTFNGALSGNATTATTLQTARSIAGVSFNGSADISLNNNSITNGAGYTTNTGTVTGSGATNRVPFWSSSSNIASSAALTFVSNVLYVDQAFRVKTGGTLVQFASDGDTDTGLGNFDGNGQLSLLSNNKEVFTAKDDKNTFNAYVSTSVATTGSLNPNQSQQALTSDTLANLTVDPTGNIVRGSQEGTWTFTKAQIDALTTSTTSGTTLIAAPGADKAIIVEESNLLIRYSGTGTMSSNSFVIRQANNGDATAEITRLPSGQINTIMSSAPTNPSYGFYSRDLPLYNGDGRSFVTNKATFLSRISTNATPANLISISIKLKYRMFNASTF